MMSLCALLICGSYKIVKGDDCQYENVIGKCLCDPNSHINIIENVILVEIQSETCNCTLTFLNNMDAPQITNTFDRSCTWNCTSTMCSKYLPLQIYNQLFTYFIKSHSNFSLISWTCWFWMCKYKKKNTYPLLTWTYVESSLFIWLISLSTVLKVDKAYLKIEIYISKSHNTGHTKKRLGAPRERLFILPGASKYIFFGSYTILFWSKANNIVNNNTNMFVQIIWYF